MIRKFNVDRMESVYVQRMALEEIIGDRHRFRFRWRGFRCEDGDLSRRGSSGLKFGFGFGFWLSLGLLPRRRFSTWVWKGREYRPQVRSNSTSIAEPWRRIGTTRPPDTRNGLGGVSVI